ELSPAIRSARRALDGLLQCSIGERLDRHGALLAGTGGRTLRRDAALRAIGCADAPLRVALLARYRAEHGASAPAWDVAAVPDDEAPDRVLAAASLCARGRPPEARHAHAIAEAEAAARRLA